ncbi:HEAT repeat domain-containing protein [Halococcus agarilyticus]|uniref:HEAT repeat domain-containing protein n=1 Tax=Halococcus agarilyticus TaxID=1232219 RepID=UPI0006781EAA|nr:hypothetical protein [Halococcus agarilyticus]
MAKEPGEDSLDADDSDGETVEKPYSDAAIDGSEAVVATGSKGSASAVSTNEIGDPAGIIASDDTGVSIDDRRSAASAIVERALAGHIRTSEAVATLAAGLDDPVSEAVSLRALLTIAEECPGAVDPVLDAVGRRLTDAPVVIRRHSSRIVVERADDDPAAVTGLVSQLVETVVAGRADIPDGERPSYRRSRLEPRAVVDEGLGRRAAAVLGDIARTEPESIAPEIGRLDPVFDPDTAWNVRLREQVAAVVQSVAIACPEASMALVPSLVELLEAENVPASARAGGAAALAALAETRSERVADRVGTVIPALESLLTDDDPSVRARAGSLLSYVAQHHPEAAAPLTHPLIDRLDDEPVPVRASTVWTLGYVDTELARETLRAVASADRDPDLRALAADRLRAATDE